MKINFAKLGIIASGLIGGVYVLFLAAPFILTPIIQRYIPDLEATAKQAGIEVKIEGLSLATTPNLHAGVRVKTVGIKDIGNLENIGIDLKLFPLLSKNIEFAKIYAKGVNLNLITDKNGKLAIADLFTPKEETKPFEMPFGLKLSEKMPNISVEAYKFGLNNVYYVNGEKLKVYDFVLNKKIKISTLGKIIFENNIISNYDIIAKSGKKPSIDLALKVNTKLTDVVKLVNNIAQTFGINDFKTLSATGAINADFKINSDLKKVLSSGYLKILPSSVKYGLYNVAIDNITADIDLADNNINIKNSGFSILGHSLKLSGTVTSDAVADLKLSGQGLSIKNLIVTTGQAALLKDNNVNSGTLSVIASVKGKLTEISPDVSIDVANLNIYNKPMNLKLAVPVAKIIADMNLINIKNSYAIIDKSRIDINGTIKDYLHDKLDIDLKAKFNGVISTLVGSVTNFEKPKLNLTVTVPQNISFPIPYMANSNITGLGSIIITGTPERPKLSGQATLADISIKDLNFKLADTVLEFNGSGIAGNARAKGLKFNNIVGSNITTKFSLKDFNLFSLKDINSTFWNGAITGEILYNIATTGVNVDVSGKELNSTDAVFATTAIPKALTGTLDFRAKLSTNGLTDVDMIKNMKGNVSFGIKNGRFVSIGKIENIVQAQNITSVSLLKSAISALSTAATVQQTDKFDNITGELTLAGGAANISVIKVTGPLMSYYVKGVYNILPNTANLVILGRLDAKTVAVLGPLGQLSADKLLSYIPKFGASTAQYLNQLTSDPKNEDTSLIPALSTGNKDYKDFKVIFNGAVDKVSSMKSFKWLSVCDTTKMNVKEDVQNAAKAVKENVNSQVESAKNTVQNVKTNVTNTLNTTTQKVQNETSAAKQTVEDIKNIDTKQTVKNLGNLLKNAAINANKQVETPKEESQLSETVAEPEEE